MQIRTSKYSDFMRIAENIRADDLLELMSCSDGDIETIMSDMYYNIDHSVTFSFGGKIAGVFGLKRIVGMPYLVAFMVTTDEVNHNKVAFFRECKKYLLRNRLETIGNIVDMRYSSCINWLKRLGFRETGRRFNVYDGSEFMELVLCVTH